MNEANLVERIDWDKLKRERTVDKGALVSIPRRGEFFLSVNQKEFGLPDKYAEVFADIAAKTYRYILKEEFKGDSIVIPFEVETLDNGFVKLVTRHFRYTVCDMDTQWEWYEKNRMLSTTMRSPYLAPPSLQGRKDNLGYVAYIWSNRKIPDMEVVNAEIEEIK
ncbi:hypothetical protein J4459_03560 [Candidatus Woesearchaeota archaeon]|nr:hypothetical protein [Candidatus Woesearchaeota archaeon]